MRIAEILHRKGSAVSTIRSVEAVDSAIRKLSDQHIGALVVLDRWGKLVGLLSERDILYALDRHGMALLAHRVDEVMNPDHTTCGPEDRVDQVMALMTAHRVRHLPVLDRGRLVGIVSIGDLVKHRLQEKEQETNVLREMRAV